MNIVTNQFKDSCNPLAMQLHKLILLLKQPGMVQSYCKHISQCKQIPTLLNTHYQYSTLAMMTSNWPITMPSEAACLVHVYINTRANI